MLQELVKSIAIALIVVSMIWAFAFMAFLDDRKNVELAKACLAAGG